MDGNRNWGTWLDHVGPTKRVIFRVFNRFQDLFLDIQPVFFGKDGPLADLARASTFWSLSSLSRKLEGPSTWSISRLGKAPLLLMMSLDCWLHQSCAIIIHTGPCTFGQTCVLIAQTTAPRALSENVGQPKNAHTDVQTYRHTDIQIYRYAYIHTYMNMLM